MRSLTEELKAALKMNGYIEGTISYRKPGKRKESTFVVFRRSGPRRDKTITFLGHGWVEVFVREYPMEEGWSEYRTNVGRALKYAVPFW